MICAPGVDGVFSVVLYYTIRELVDVACSNGRSSGEVL